MYLVGRPLRGDVFVRHGNLTNRKLRRKKVIIKTEDLLEKDRIFILTGFLMPAVPPPLHSISLQKFQITGSSAVYMHHLSVGLKSDSGSRYRNGETIKSR
jgi:hypothetical protein